jgi:lysophospholipase L1-like esterase
LQHRLTAVLLALTTVLMACGASKSGSATPTSSVSVTPSATVGPPKPGNTYYLSIGDSYAAGYQPIKGRFIGRTSTNGFAYQLAAKATLRGHKLTLINYGCGGVTTTSLLEQKGCLPFLLGPKAPDYSKQTQAAAAFAFLRAHRGSVGLVTVSIGGNDVAGCARSDDPTDCLRSKMTTLSINLQMFLRELRAAAGPDVFIVGLTYPDVLLGGDVSEVPLKQALAPKSIALFKTLLNPTLKAGYDAIGATFIDVTAATGAYIPVGQSTTLAPYGKIPVAVAKVCELTYYCDEGDIHPRTAGYTLIANLIAQVLPKT